MNEPSPHPLDQALDTLPAEGGTAEIDDPDGDARIDAAEVDRLGVRLKGVRVRFTVPRDVREECEQLPERLRELNEPVVPVEVDPALGGGVLRTPPDAMREREYFEIGVRPGSTEIRRFRVRPDGGRERADWTMTRDQLRRLLEGVRGD